MSQTGSSETHPPGGNGHNQLQDMCEVREQLTSLLDSIAFQLASDVTDPKSVKIGGGGSGLLPVSEAWDAMLDIYALSDVAVQSW